MPQFYLFYLILNDLMIYFNEKFMHLTSFQKLLYLQYKKNIVNSNIINIFIFQDTLNLPQSRMQSNYSDHHQIDSSFQEQIMSNTAFQNEQRTSYGNYIILMKKNNKPILTLGPHWYVFIIAFIILTGMFIFVIIEIQPRISFIKQIMIKVSTILFALSYLIIGLSSPGFTQRNNLLDKAIQSKYYCEQCQLIRGKEDYHCSQCNICIKQLDHHCPWIGKCVGKDNLNAFYFFIIMTFGNLLIIFFISSTAANKSSNGIQKLM